MDVDGAARRRARALEGYVLNEPDSVRFGGKILAFGQIAARDYLRAAESPRPAALIAITSAGWPPPQSFLSPRGVKTLRLVFNDIVEPNSGFPGSILFDEDHRVQILRFINGLSDQTTLVVHCRHGVSRSRAVVAALRRLRGEDDVDEWVDGDPNEHVYRTMLGAKRP